MCCGVVGEFSEGGEARDIRESSKGERGGIEERVPIVIECSILQCSVENRQEFHDICTYIVYNNFIKL